VSKQKPQLTDLPVEQLKRGQYQPRCQFDQDSLQELADSIQSNGLIQPIVVRPLDESHYEIVAGERRWRAAQLAGLATVSCLVNDYSDKQAAEAAMIENIQRQDLNPIEVATAYQRLIDEFDYLHEEVAAAVGKSRTKITNALRLLNLTPEVRTLLIDRKLSEGHGKILAGLSVSLQKTLAQKCVAGGWSVRKIESEAKKTNTINSGNVGETDPNLLALSSRLSEHLGSQVKIDFEVDKGKIQINFHNLDILEGIFEKIGFRHEEG